MKSLVKAALEKHAPKLLYGYQLHRKRGSESEIGLLPALCRPDAASVDVGANKGLYCRYMLPHSAAVLAFEPLPVMQQRLRTHFGSSVTLYPVALSDIDGTSTIRMPKGSTAWATIDTRNTLAAAGDAEIETVNVDTRRLDSYGLDHVGFIKIDVEGHEEAVLRGAAETICRSQPSLLVEIEERHNPGSIGRVVSFLAKLGYTAHFFAEGTLRPLCEFELSRDQPVSNVGMSGKLGPYINNFIFLHELHGRQVRERLDRWPW